MATDLATDEQTGAKQPIMVAQDGLTILPGLGLHEPTRGGASPTPWAVPCGLQPTMLGPNHEQRRGEHQRRRPVPVPHFNPLQGDLHIMSHI